MHPIMSNLDIAVRQHERELHLQAIQHELMTRDVARLNGKLGPLGRLADAIREFVDPRGFALRQIRQHELALGTTGSMQIVSPTPPARVHIFPAIISKDRESAWRQAA